jgi:hypothetical protein
VYDPHDDVPSGSMTINRSSFPGRATMTTLSSTRRALRAFDRWTLRTFNPMPKPLGLGPFTR